MGNLVKMAAATSPSSFHDKHLCGHLCKLYMSTISLARAGDVETNPGPRTDTEKSFDEIMRDIAEDVSDDDKTEKLGLAFGFNKGRIDNYIKTNMRFQNVTSRGTQKMLEDWHDDVGKAEERSKLREALIKAKLRSVADKHLPTDLQSGSSQSSQAGSPGGLKEVELVNLAGIIDPNYYDAIGIHLGITFGELKQFKVDHPANVKGALTKAFMTWNSREKGDNKRETLAKKLEEVQLNDLADKLRRGRFSS